MKSSKIRTSFAIFIFFYFSALSFSAEFIPPYVKNFKDNPMVKGGKNWKANNPKGISVPFGMKKDIFLQLLDSVCTPLFLKATVVLFYGSRTHFSYGYGPASDSDLDVGFIMKKEEFSAEIYLEIMDKVNEYLNIMSKKAALGIGVDLPFMNKSFEEELLDGIFVKKISPKEEREIFLQLWKKYKGTDYLKARNIIKKEYLTKVPMEEKGMFLREAIIVLKEKQQNFKVNLSLLKQLGYENLVTAACD